MKKVNKDLEYVNLIFKTGQIFQIASHTIDQMIISDISDQYHFFNSGQYEGSEYLGVRKVIKVFHLKLSREADYTSFEVSNSEDPELIDSLFRVLANPKDLAKVSLNYSDLTKHVFSFNSLTHDLPAKVGKTKEGKLSFTVNLR